MNEHATKNVGNKTTRILVAEDHALVRRGIIDMLGHEPDLKVCGEATTGAEALALFKSEHPDLVLADLTLREGNGIELIREIRATGSRVPILVLSMREETMFAERVIRAGAQGYVGKSAPSERLISAIRQVLRGELALSAHVTERLVRRAAGLHAVSSPTPVPTVLSDRELEIFEMFGRGLTASEIARRLHISAKTVQAHRENIKAKLELATSTALTRYATLWADGDRAAIERSSTPPPPRPPGPNRRDDR
jgi:DNA-binding NarL/FixJ family response regulator